MLMGRLRRDPDGHACISRGAAGEMTALTLALLLPVALVLAAGLAIYRLAPPRREPADAGTES